MKENQEIDKEYSRMLEVIKDITSNSVNDYVKFTGKQIFEETVIRENGIEKHYDGEYVFLTIVSEMNEKFILTFNEHWNKTTELKQFIM